MYKEQQRKHDPDFETVAKNFERDFRRLKLLMSKAEARNEEQAFFALELKARRLRMEPRAKAIYWLTCWFDGIEPGGVSRFEKFGSRVYELVSDFGGSISKPLYALGATIFIFAGVYGWLGDRCGDPLNPDEVQQRIVQLAGDQKNNPEIVKRLRLSDAAFTQEPLRWNEAFVLAAARTLLPIGRQEGRFEWWDRTVELAPFCTFVAGAVHRIISVLLIFLFALTVRRHFQIS